MSLLERIFTEEPIDKELQKELDEELESEKPHWLCPPCDHIKQKKCSLRKNRKQVVSAWDEKIHPLGCPDFFCTPPCKK